VIRDLDDAALADEAVAAEVAVIYKHSPRCGSSLVAEAEVKRFADRHPEVPVYRVDVLGHRALSRSLAQRLHVRHESPQVILLRNGAVAWVGSHGHVDADALATHLEARSVT
jgi:bacillithiol system protein YtxJ